MPEAEVLPAKNEDPPVTDRHVDKKDGGHPDRPWYADPPKLAGVLGFVLSLAGLGERVWVREQEEVQQKLQHLRDATTQLADIQGEYLDAVARSPANIYALGVAKNTKRQMHLQTAAALLRDSSVNRQASAQIFAALGVELTNDGRYGEGRAYLSQALNAPGADPNTRTGILRTLAGIYKMPGTGFTDQAEARRHYDEARALLAQRTDDAGILSLAETILTEASMDVTYGDPAHAKGLAEEALAKIKTVRNISPFRTQLERIATGFLRGEQYSQTQQQAVPQEAAQVRATESSVVSLELWEPVPGQVSGLEADISIDGKVVGQLSNTKGRQQLALPPLSPGVHKFAVSNGRVYMISSDRTAMQAGAGIACSGLFEVSPGTVRLRANVASGPNGVFCALQ